MTVREATSDDLADVVRMGGKFLATTRYGGLLAHNPDALEQMAQMLLEMPDGFLLVAEEAGVAVGMIGCLVFTHPLSGERFASELAWWMEPDHRGAGVRLLRAAERKASDLGVTKIQMIAPDARVAGFYLSRGYEYVEATYQRTL